MEIKDYLKELLRKYAAGVIDEKEKDVLFSYLAKEEYHQYWKGAISELRQDTPEHPEYNPSEWEPMLQSIFSSEQQAAIPVRQMHNNWWWRAAAVILLVIAVAAIFYNRTTEVPVEVVKATPAPTHVADVPAGKDGAILTLGDGSQIVLDSLGNGIVTTQGNAKVSLNNGRLAYTQNGNATAEVFFNTISTPRGRQYRLQLPDGTNVWLNAASSLKYPTAFTGKERRVVITGEAYFEVARQANMPFRVSFGSSSEIEVLGTHFNVNAYTEESSMNTTLLEGSVKISTAGNQPVEIKPGQQAQVGAMASGKGSLKVVNDVNIENVVAWKNGAFSFDDATMRQVLRQLSRWYDVEVEYRGQVADKIIRGKMGRDLTLAQIIIVLRGLRINLAVEGGRKLVVLPDETNH